MSDAQKPKKSSGKVVLYFFLLLAFLFAGVVFISNTGNDLESKRGSRKFAPKFSKDKGKSATSNRDLDAVELNTLGSKQMEANDFKAAENTFRQLLQIKKDDPAGFHNLGMALFSQERYEESLPYFQEAVNLNPNSEESILSFANAARLKGDLSVSQTLLENLVKVKPENAKAFMNLGLTYDAARDPGKATVAYVKSLELDPSNPTARYNLGNAYLRTSKLDEAKQQYQKAIELKPDYAKAFSNLGNVFLKQGDTISSQKYFKMALQLDPKLRERVKSAK